MLMLGYSLLLAVGLALSLPWWLFRLATTQRYREGLGQRLGRVAATLRETVRGRRVVWVHAVSVGEVLAASRLVAELEPALEAAFGGAWRVVVSTTTRTGQELAQKRFGAERVFYYPLDLGFAVRAYLDALRPEALVLMESELWPRLVYECERRRIPVAVANARVSDRSFRRGTRVRVLWGKALRKVSLWLAQSEEDARRLCAMGARADAVRVSGNLKYDVRSSGANAMTRRVEELLGGTRLVVAGSTLEGEEAALLAAWTAVRAEARDVALLIAPRHPERFDAVAEMVRGKGLPLVRCSGLAGHAEPITADTVLVLDTIGDLAAMYGLAAVAFVGGSLAPRGGHNPLEPAQFGVPVIIGRSFENFRDIVAKMQAQQAICIVQDEKQLEAVMLGMLKDGDAARATGERGREVFEAQQGATARSVEAIVALIPGGAQ